MKDFYLVLLSLEIFNIGFSIDFEKYTIDDKSEDVASLKTCVDNG